MTRALKNMNYLGAVMAGKAKREGKKFISIQERWSKRNIRGKWNVNSRSSITVYL